MFVLFFFVSSIHILSFSSCSYLIILFIVSEYLILILIRFIAHVMSLIGFKSVVISLTFVRKAFSVRFHFIFSFDPVLSSCFNSYSPGNLLNKIAGRSKTWRRKTWKSKPCYYFYSWKCSSDHWYESGQLISTRSFYFIFIFAGVFHCHYDIYIYIRELVVWVRWFCIAVFRKSSVWCIKRMCKVYIL